MDSEVIKGIYKVIAFAAAVGGRIGKQPATSSSSGHNDNATTIDDSIITRGKC